MRCDVYYMILGTEEFNTGVSKVYFRPTKRRPVNYIYVNTCYLDVINAYPWRRLEGCVGYKDKDTIRNLGSLIWEKYNKDPAQFVLRLNNCEIDYTYANLGNSPSRQNRRMIPHRGYSLRSEKCEFVVTATYDYYTGKKGAYSTEVEACKAAYLLEQEFKVPCQYNFLRDRRYDWDLLEREYTGAITRDDSYMYRIVHYALSNAWYVHRYNLTEWFEKFGFTLPIYYTDDCGRMRNGFTKELLCPL